MTQNTLKPSDWSFSIRWAIFVNILGVWSTFLLETAFFRQHDEQKIKKNVDEMWTFLPLHTHGL